jgi:hypothetical protein
MRYTFHVDNKLYSFKNIESLKVILRSLKHQVTKKNEFLAKNVFKFLKTVFGKFGENVENVTGIQVHNFVAFADTQSTRYVAFSEGGLQKPLSVSSIKARDYKNQIGDT